MKKSNLFILFFIILFSTHSSFAQDITGLWKGLLYNDTTKKFLDYELAISEENGKFSGYSYTIFDIEGKKEVGVKKLKIKRKDDKLMIEDVELIANNYSEPPPKGVHQYSVLILKTEDSILVLDGKWNTNRTKKYIPITGTIRLERKNDFRQAALIKKLDSMQLTAKLSFVEPEKKQGVAIVGTPVLIETVIPGEEKQPIATKTATEKPKANETTVVAENKIEQPKANEVSPVAANTIEPAPERKVAAVAVAAPTEKAVAPTAKIEPAVIKPVVIPAAAQVAKRKVATTQTVYYKSDSLVLSLYDNGEVDGDTVSILMNGELIFSKQGLTTKASNKTIHINKDTPDSLLLVMYAESLGTIPPNTGLLVVRDGESAYELRFSADLQSNAQIILRRKPE